MQGISGYFKVTQNLFIPKSMKKEESNLSLRDSQRNYIVQLPFREYKNLS